MNSRLFFSALGLAVAFAPVARAQGMNDSGVVAPIGRSPVVSVPGAGGVAAPVAPTNVVNVSAANLVNLPTLLARAGAVSLGATAADLNNNPAARDALLSYVGQGGTVFLHTDAARLFGYRTVAARETTNQRVGQLYGRARAAVPFGTVPLLWSGDVAGARNSARAPGINNVFYTLRAGDDLVINHPAGTPLLQVTGTGNSPLYAAAIAPFGAGWAVFTPDSIDQTRADGAAFARNLLKLVGGSRYVGVSQAVISNGDGLLAELSRAVRNGGGQSAPLPGLGADLPVAREAATAPVAPAPIAREGTDAMAPAATQNQAPGAAMQPPAAPYAGPVLLLTRGEATALGSALQNEPQTRGAVALAILRARVALLNNNDRAAQTQLALAERLAPTAGEIPFLRGTAAVAGAGFLGATSADRVASANFAANSFAAASRARPFFGFNTGTNFVGGNVAGTNVGGGGIVGGNIVGGNVAGGNVAGGIVGGNVAGGSNVGGANIVAGGTTFYDDITGAQLDSLGAQLNRFSQVLALEPPLSRVVGDVTIRYFSGDTAVPFVARGVAALTQSPLFNNAIDDQEILLFPTPALYQRYRAAMGLDQQNVPLPAASFGDVVDGRILMVSIPAARPVTIGPNGVPRVLPLRATSASLLTRFEAYALLESYVGDGNNRIPAWMVLGLSTLADSAINGDTVSVGFDQELRRYASTGNLLAPRQFDAQLGETSQLAQAQSAAIMRYFYARYGAGRVAETIQRIGAGQSADDALLATTGLDELGLFREWRAAQFAGLNLRN